MSNCCNSTTMTFNERPQLFVPHKLSAISSLSSRHLNSSFWCYLSNIVAVRSPCWFGESQSRAHEPLLRLHVPDAPAFTASRLPAAASTCACLHPARLPCATPLIEAAAYHDGSGTFQCSCSLHSMLFRCPAFALCAPTAAPAYSPFINNIPFPVSLGLRSWQNQHWKTYREVYLYLEPLLSTLQENS
jgi:hypothetical protein